jgi:5-methylcytosine-specific restriction enzyme A
MPVVAPKPCKHAGCGALVRHESGYCDKHRHHAKSGKFADPWRGSRQSRGYGAGWEAKRQETFARDNGLCQECLRMGIIHAPTGRARICDHRIPKFEGGTDDSANLQTLCRTCSDRKTADEARRARRGPPGEGGCKVQPPHPTGPAGSPNFYGRRF